ncbi:MAG: MBL fold metallo-hydrolase [Candidatus Bathyarchaeota archaeon]|nr:MBL fold metallo-hydrolase [Candidatus Bathyarchaeota archaeon]
MAYSNDTESDIIVPKKWYEKLPREVWSHYPKVDQTDPWFEIYKLTESVYAIYEDGQFEEVISYLVLGEEKAALIDTGNGIGNIKAVVDGLTDLPVIVVNTHTHGDHIGGNHQFTDVAVLESDFSHNKADNGQTREQMGHYIDGDMVWKPLPPYLDVESWRIHPFKVTRWLKDGDKVELGDRTLDVVHTPGHSPDSICLLDKKNKILWTGDSFYPAPIYVYAPTTNLDQFIASFKKMTDMIPSYEWVMPSHNEPRMERHLIKECYEAAVNIKNGTAGEYTEGEAAGIKVHRYDYERFSLIVRAERA